MMIKVSKESIHHFSCQVCREWWSIADWKPTKFITCPHCGDRDAVVKEGK